jgi:hypothetical protein
VTVVAVTVPVAMRMAVAMSSGWRCIGDGSRRAIVRVVAVIVVVRVRMHGRYDLFYARWRPRRSAATYLVDILTRRRRDSVDGV